MPNGLVQREVVVWIVEYGVYTEVSGNAAERRTTYHRQPTAYGGRTSNDAKAGSA